MKTGIALEDIIILYSAPRIVIPKNTRVEVADEINNEKVLIRYKGFNYIIKKEELMYV